MRSRTRWPGPGGLMDLPESVAPMPRCPRPPKIIWPGGRSRSRWSGRSTGCWSGFHPRTMRGTLLCGRFAACIGRLPLQRFIFVFRFARLSRTEPPPAGRPVMLDTVKREAAAPFDTARLDRLMDAAGIDVLFATSKPNVQYLLGGHRSFFFDTMDAIGITRYLPVVVYVKGAPQKAGYFGHRMEGYQTEIKPFWVSETNTRSSGAVDVMQRAAEYVHKLAAKPKRIGV